MGAIIPLCGLYFGFAIIVKDDIELITSYSTGILGNCEKALSEEVYGRKAELRANGWAFREKNHLVV